jgi:hypothetical protein
MHYASCTLPTMDRTRDRSTMRLTFYFRIEEVETPDRYGKQTQPTASIPRIKERDFVFASFSECQISMEVVC